MNVSSKGFISLFFVFTIFLSFFIVPNLTDNNTALLYFPVIDHNKIKAITTNTLKSDMFKKTIDLDNLEYVTNKCNELQIESTKNVGIIQKLSVGKNVCEEQDAQSSIYEKGITISYNPKEVTMFNADGSKYNLSKGCHSLTDTCVYNGSETLIESYCDTTKQVVTYKEIDCPPGYLCNQGACIQPFCGDGLVLNSEECDDGNVFDNDGCNSNCKIEKKPVDLYVGNIEKNAISKKCMNYFSFEICNAGPGAITQNFNVQISGNDNNITIPISITKYGSILSGSCTLIEEPGYSNVLGLNLSLNELVEIEIYVDSDNNFVEENENNNVKSETVYSGFAYMYDEITECEAACYDSDGGWKYPASVTKGTLFFTGDYYFNEKQEDACSLFGIELTEYFCGIYENWKGEIVAGSGQVDVPCYLQNKKCDGGKCIDLELGESKNNLSCIESEEPGTFSGGDVLFTDFKGESHDLKSSCSDNTLTYYGCDGLKPYKLESDCWWDNALCVEDKCVKGEIEFGCEKLDFNYFDSGMAFAQKKIKVGDIISPFEDKQVWDSCVDNYGQILKEAVCGVDNAEFVDYNCAEVGATCVNSKCVIPDFNLKYCNDWDSGLNVFEIGGLDYINEFNVYGSSWDSCVDENQILEFYCDGIDYKTAILNCKDFGENYGCVEDSETGAFCGLADESKQVCKENSFGVEYIDIYGLEKTKNNNCKNYGTYENQLFASEKWSCDGKKPVKTSTKCKENEACYNNYKECKPLVEPQCLSSDGNDPLVLGNIFYINKFGQGGPENWEGCKPTSGIMKESYCDGKNTIEDLYDCKSILNNQDAICHFGADMCMVYDQYKNYCKETEYGIEYGDGYVIEKRHDVCNDDIWSLVNMADYSLSNDHFTYVCDESMGYNLMPSQTAGDGTVCVYNFVDQNGIKVLNKINIVSMGDFGINDYMPISIFEGLYDYIGADIYKLQYDSYKTQLKSYLEKNLSLLISKVVEENNAIGLKTCLAVEDPSTIYCPTCYNDWGVSNQKYVLDMYNLLDDVKPGGVDVCLIPLK